MMIALKNNKAEGKILTIANYSSDASIDECVAKGCSMDFTLTKREGSEFIVEWKYTGGMVFKGEYKISNVRITS